MKLSEAMKRLRIIEKRMEDNSKAVTKYASLLSNEKPQFDSEDKQKSEVNQLIQASTDLMKEYLTLKTKIERTNLETVVEVGGKKYSLSELLIIKRKMANHMIDTYRALNDSMAESKMRNGMAQKSDTAVTIVKMYSEKDKNDNLSIWQDLRDNIDSRIDVVNATTELI
jgi:hypothetical protein